VAAELALGLDGRDARPHTNRIILTRTPSFTVIAAMNRCATQNQVQHRAEPKKTNPTLALGMRKDGALRRLAGLMNLVATNLVVVNLLVLTRFVPQGQFDSVPQS
jgi:hypothetical protein